MFSRKSIVAMFGIILLVMLLSNIFGFSNANYKPKYGITTANINFRTMPNSNSTSKIRVISKNTNLKMVGEISDFYIVQLSTNEVGLVSKSYIANSSTPPANAKVYQSLSKYYGYIKSNNTNIRSGPGTNFSSRGKLSKDQKLEVIGKIDNWLLVITENNLVGMVRDDMISKTAPTNQNNSATNNAAISSEANTILELINKARTDKGLSKLTINPALNNVAQTKTDDMVKNSYFAHNSPSYGSPFEMMQNLGIKYKTAGENIAGNPSLENAVKSWLNSDTHKQNILSNAYNYIGIGVTKSNTYGYVISAMFIGV